MTYIIHEYHAEYTYSMNHAGANMYHAGASCTRITFMHITRLAPAFAQKQTKVDMCALHMSNILMPMD